MHERPNNYNDQAETDRDRMEMATRIPKHKSSLLVLLDLCTGNPADLDSVQQYFTKFHIERNHL